MQGKSISIDEKSKRIWNGSLFTYSAILETEENEVSGRFDFLFENMKTQEISTISVNLKDCVNVVTDEWVVKFIARDVLDNNDNNLSLDDRLKIAVKYQIAT